MRWHNIKCHKEIYDYLINYFDDADDTNSSASEILYRIIHNILVKPKCLVCGKPAKFTRFDRGYGQFCSEQCRRIYRNKKRNEDNLKKKLKDTGFEIKYCQHCGKLIPYNEKHKDNNRFCVGYNRQFKGRSYCIAYDYYFWRYRVQGWR